MKFKGKKSSATSIMAVITLSSGILLGASSLSKMYTRELEYKEQIQLLNSENLNLLDEQKQLLSELDKKEKEIEELNNDNLHVRKQLDERKRELDKVSRGSSISSNNISLQVNKKSNLPPKYYDTYFANSGMANLGETFYNIEQEYNVNGIFLAAIAALESGHGNSRLAKERNNLTGFAAYDGNVNKAKYFESKEHCLTATAKLLANNYLTEDGKYFNGATVEGVNVKYCSDRAWAGKIKSKMNSIKNTIK